MNRISKLIFSFLILLVAVVASGQTVEKIADVDIGPPFDATRNQFSSNGQYVACAIDSIGVLRIRTFPVEYRDTVSIPDSAMNVWAIGVTRFATLLTFESRTSGLVHLAAVAHGEKEWRVLDGVMPVKDSTLGTLQKERGITAVTASALSTVAIVGAYAPDPKSWQRRYRTVFIDAQTYEVVRTLDSVIIRGVNANGMEYYDNVSSYGNKCSFYDGSTGARLRTVDQPGSDYKPTGVDHLMFNSAHLTALGQVPVQILSYFGFIEACVVSPNLYAVNNAVDSTLELLDVVTRKRMVVDAGGFVTIDNLDSTLTISHERPFRLRVFRLSGMQRHEGLVSVRQKDTTDIFSGVTYGAVYVGTQQMSEMSAVIDGQSYSMMGTRAYMEYVPERVGAVPFTVIAKAFGSGTLYRDSMVPLVVRYPGNYHAAIKPEYGARELSLSMGDRCLGAGDDMFNTFVAFRLSGVDAPVFDTIKTIRWNGLTLHSTMSPLHSDDSYVIEKLRGNGQGTTANRWSVEQMLMRFDGSDSTLIRSVLLPPDFTYARVSTAYSSPNNIIGMQIRTYPMLSNRVYLTTQINGSYMPVGDSTGIENRTYGAFDLSMPGRVVMTDFPGRVTMQGYVDTAKVVDATTRSLPAMVINDSTILMDDRFYRLQAGMWRPDREIFASGTCKMFIRLTPTYTVALRGDSEQVGYIINTNSRSVVDSLGKGFFSARCAIYSKRYHGLFIGHLSNVIGFLPLPPQYTEPTDVRERVPLRSSEFITSCKIYTLQGNMVAETDHDGELSTMHRQRLSLPLSDTDAAQLHLPNGLYIVVYAQEHGPAYSSLLMVWQ
ncbi:MAG: hypothetical protein JSS89_08525 [Bacteroidetes bacterium]|nr:hypothetical protein [Bacteroidota bacterium]